MSRLIDKTRKSLADHGPWETLKKIVRFILRPVYRREINLIYTCDLASFNISPVKTEKYSITFIGPHDVAIIRQIEEMEEWLRDQVAARLRNGGRCIAALEGETVVGFLLGTMNTMILPPVDFVRPLRPDEFFGEQITVRMKYRRQGLSTLLRNAFLGELKKLGIRKYYLSAHAMNIPSIRAIEKYGYRYLAHMSWRRIGTCTTVRFRRVDSRHRS